MKNSLWMVVIEAAIILFLIFLFVKYIHAYEIYEPSFHWVFVVNDYFKDEKITNQTLVTNSPRNMIYDVGGKKYRFYAETAWTIIVLVDGKFDTFYSIYYNYKKGTPMYDKLKPAQRITGDSR
jgi:cytochrome b subunit of formate dehydrogenase